MGTERRLTSFWIVLASLLMALGCGGSGGGGGGDSGAGGVQPQSNTQAVQKTSASSDAVNEGESAATQAIVEQGLQSSGLGRAAPASALEGLLTGFDFPTTVDTTVNLDQTLLGEDLYPNATGTLGVQATSTGNSGTSTAGSTTYDVTVTAVTEVVYTDPELGYTSTVAPGESFTYSLTVTWQYTDAENWSVTTSADLTVTDLTVTVADDGGTSVDVTLAATATLTGSVTAVNGVVTYGGSGSGSWEASWLGLLGTTRTVGMDVDSLDAITVTIDGTTYGPYTADELAQEFAVVMEATAEEVTVSDLEDIEGAEDAAETLVAVQDALTWYAASQGSAGATASRAARAAAAFGVSPDTVFPATIEETLDLSTLDPNASGTVHLLLVGELGTPGQVTYSGAATCATTVTYTDPEGEFASAIPANEAIALDLVIAWTFTDRDNWSLNTVSTATAAGFDVTVDYTTDGGPRSIDAVLDAELTAYGEIVNDSAEVTWDGHLGGYWAVTWTDDNDRVHTVGLQIDSLEDISLVVGDLVLGHFSASELYQKYLIAVERFDGEKLATVQAAVAAVADLKKAASQAILESSQHNWFTSKLDRSAARSAAAVNLDLGLFELIPTSVDQTVDLSQYDDNATGTVRVTGSGTATRALSGNVTYDDVTVTCTTDVTYHYVDGDVTLDVVIDAGTQIHFGLVVAWQLQQTLLAVDTDNWVVTVTVTSSAADVPLSGTYRDAETTLDLDLVLDETLDLEFTITAEDGVATYSTDVYAVWSVSWTETNRRGQEVEHTVIVTVTALGNFSIQYDNLPALEVESLGETVESILALYGETP